MTKLTRQTKELAAHFADQLSGWASIATRPLFGAVALYREEHVFAMVWQGSLYFKVSDLSRGDFEAAGSQAMGYVSKGQDQALKSYWAVPVDVIEDRKQLIVWAQRAWEDALKGAKS